MTLLHAVSPQDFIDSTKSLPANGRGAWTKVGIDFEYRYALAPDSSQRIGTRAQVSLDHWAVAAGSFAIKKRLIDLGFMAPLADSERGIFGPRTQDAVKAFQAKNADPQGGRALSVDGIVGTSDARALFYPLVVKAMTKYGIPEHLLVGETNHESVFDPGAVGYFIYYPDYRGVDRGLSQINSKGTVSWLDAFDPAFCIDWSGKRLRDYFNQYAANYPKQDTSVLWEAAVCAHNSPVNGNNWAKNGGPTNETAAAYVDGVRKATF